MDREAAEVGDRGFAGSRAGTASSLRARRPPRRRRRRSRPARSRCARSPRGRTRDPSGRTTARNGSTSSWVKSSTRKSTSSALGAPDRDAHTGSSCAAARARRIRSPGREGDSREDEHEPAEGRDRHRLVQERRAVEDGEAGDEVRHERQPPRAEEAQHPEENELREGGAEDRQRRERRDGLGVGDVVGELEERERHEQQPSGEHRARREHRAGDRLHAELTVDPGRRVRE